MPDIQLIGHQLIILDVMGFVKEGFWVHEYDWKELGREILGNYVYLIHGEFGFREFKEDDENENYLSAKIWVKYMVGNFDNQPERIIYNTYITLTLEKLQEIFDVAFSKNTVEVNLKPPPDSGIFI